MKDLEDFLWGFSIISLALYFLQNFKKAISMASLSLNSPLSSSLPPPLSWVRQFLLDEQREGSSLLSEFSETKVVFAPEKSLQSDSLSSTCEEGEGEENNILQKPQSCGMKRKGLHDGNLHEDNSGVVMMYQEEKINKQEDMHYEAYHKGLHDKNSQENPGFMIKKGSDMVGIANYVDKSAIKLKKRPGRLVLPQCCPELEFRAVVDRKLENKEFEIQGRDFFLASKKGRREVMEDGYGVIVDILGDAKQAFFAVIDGHGGRAATDFVAENLGKNIVKALENVGKEDDDELEQAIRGGYLLTDKEFLSQGLSSGACASSVLLKDGELHVANVGDCRVVLSRKGVADVLTSDHRASREDERIRIENSGGYLHCRNGIWRVHGSLAISRAIGDQHLKEWIISEPEIKRIKLTLDCEFLIMASDGLWDKVNEQEAVDVVLRERNSKESCKKLVDISFSRGNLDDITVMVINLQNFVTNGC